MTTDNQSREAFEAWLLEHVGPQWVERADESAQDDRLTYCEVRTRQLYLAWQTSRKQALESVLNCYSPDDTVTDYQDKIKEILK